MRLTPPRITVRWLMIAIAVVATLIGSVQLIRRRGQCLLHATFHASQERNFQKDIDSPPSGRASMSPATREEHERHDRARVPYHRELRWKYERAARYPWLTIEPDPPEP
jgi:hypothetical protein